jgi:hypothetical protein
MKIQDQSGVKKVVVATTVMLSFISFWRAAAIVLCDLGSSAYYAAGISEGYLGKSAPWFILGIMLFSTAVRIVDIEACSMFVRGGKHGNCRIQWNSQPGCRGWCVARLVPESP